MVQVKATFQRVVRRFTAADGITLVELCAKLKEIFPEMFEISADRIQLYYKDSDGDLVTVSSDEELRAAEGLIGEDNTLKLLVGVAEEQKSSADDDDDDDEVGDLFDIFGSLFGHPHAFSGTPSLFSHHSPFTHTSHPFAHHHHDPFTTWSDRQRMLERHEERIRRQRLYEEQMRKAHLESIKQMKEKAEAESRRRSVDGGATAGNVQQRRASKELRRASKELKPPVIPAFPPGWNVTPYGTWTPVVYQTPFGTGHMYGPWGYTATFGDNDDGKMETEEKTKEEDQPLEKEETPVKTEEPTEA